MAASSSSRHTYVRRMDVAQASTLAASTSSNETQFRRRGKTKLLDIQGSSMGKNLAVEVEFNEYGQPDSENTSKFQSYLGVLVRNETNCPVGYAEWKNVPKAYKDRMLDVVQKNWTVDLHNKNVRTYVLESLKKKYSEYRGKLRKKNFKEERSLDENLLDKPAGVSENEWARLLAYFMGKGKVLSERGKKLRAKQTLYHTTGRRSYAQVRKKLAEKKGRTPMPVEVFRETHTRKDTQALDSVASNIVVVVERIVEEKLADPENDGRDRAELEQGAFQETIGPEHPGRVRGMGLGVTPSLYFGCQRANRAEQPGVTELKREVACLKQIEVEKEQRIKKLEEDLEHSNVEKDQKIKKLEEELEMIKNMVLASQAQVGGRKKKRKKNYTQEQDSRSIG